MIAIDMINRMMQYYYENNASVPYNEMYAEYSNILNDVISTNLKLNTSFASLTNTAFYEQYMVNAFQFSYAKNEAQRLELQKLLYDSNGKKVSFEDFKTKSQSILTQFNEIWQRVEYDLASRGSVLAEKWQKIWADRDLNPYVIYDTRGDARVRPEHAILDGICFRIDSLVGKNLYVPNGWNCRCEWTTAPDPNGKVLNDKELNDLLTGKLEITNKDGSKTLKNIVEPQFRTNVGINGIMPKISSYNIVPANDLNYKLFQVPKKLSSVSIKNLSEFQKYKAIKDNIVNKNTLIFRNFKLKLNFFLEEKVLLKIQNNKGFENINSCISKPTEIWANWKDAKEQKTVQFNFILKSNNLSYIVQTLDGKIIDAFIMKVDVNNYRKGLLINT